MAAAAVGCPAGKGRDISLAALRRHDPYISRIVDVASQVALYTFGHRANEWEKTDVEGTLFVYTRSASPKHGFTIMNRLSMENRTEPITKDLDFQLQDPFLLYRNARLSIYGIWFYDKEECQRIAELMKNLAQYEQLKAHHGAVVGASPVSLSSGEGKEADILRMLSKAKDEYTKTLDPEPQHLSLTALFGKQDKATCQEAAGPPKTLHQQQQEKLPIRQGVVRSLSYEEPRRRSPPVDKQLCPAIQKLLVGSADLQPLAELPESWPCRDAARPGSPRGPEVSRRAHGAPRTQKAPDQLQGVPGAPAPAALAAALPPQTPGPRALPRPAPPDPGPGRQPPGPSEVSPRELLWKLQAVQQEQQLPAPGRPALAAKFPAASPRARARNPLESWRDQTPSAEQQAPLLQAVLTSTECVPRPCCTWYVEMRSWVPCPCGRRSPWALEVLSPRRAPPAAGLSPLMSPLVFAQPPWAPPPERGSGLLPPGSQDPAATPSGPLLPLRTPEPPRTPGSALTKPQLQEALLHLVQNDDNFLNIIYEAYLFSMTQAAMKKTL
ncbi:mRNA-decapping enzyme 1B isoform X4 [Eschrichtius robustus]|uniref:mRNA-decapping enzyme 1B isoform X4 n=1 Tax=Eschrichtius robustus TaxID=9764 RepID=UPI0035C1A309